MAGIRERLVQLTVRAREFLSGDLKPATDAMRALGDEGRRLKDQLAEAGRARGLVRTLRDTEGATGSLEQAWRDAQATLDDLTREIGDSEQATAGQRIALREARRTADEAQAAYERSQRAIKNLRTELKALNVDTDNLGSEEDRLTAEIKQNKQAVDDNREAIKQKRVEEKKAAEAAQEHASRVDAARGALTSGAKQVLAFAAAYVSLSAVFGVVQLGLNKVRDGIYAMLGTGDQYELLGKRMASLMGGIAQGEQATAWIKDFAKSTPLEVKDVTEAFALLKSYGLDPMDGSLQAIVDKNEQLGGGMERLQGISSALGQAFAKQKLQTEEILQLVERGVPAWTLLEKVTGKNAAQLADLASKGKLGRDVIAGLIDEMGRSAEGAAADNMGTLTGLVSNLSDTWSDFLNRIAKSGALDYAKEQLKGVAEYIDQMDKDGRLDKLAKSLSDAFEQGVTKAKEFADQLLGVDFNKLIDDGSAWFSDFGAKLDDAAQRVQLFFAPFRTLFNGVTAGLSLAGAALTEFASLHLSVFEQLAKAVPDVLGGDKLRASIANAKGLLDGLTAGFVEQIEQDGKDIESAWDTTAQSAARSAKEQTEAVRSESEQQIMLGQAAADHFVANQKRSKDAAIDAAASGRQAVEGLAQALQLIDTASTVQQLEGLRGALLEAFRSGQLSQEQYAQATGLLNSKLSELGGTAKGAADGVSDLEEKLGDLKSVQAAISGAKTDVDINNIRAALRKLYNDGEITATQYNQALKETSDRQKELKSAVQQGTKAQQDKNKADQAAVVTSEQLRRASGERMEAERKAIGAAMEARRKGSEEVKRDMGAMEGFFSGVLSRAREPLAGLSKAALDAYDKLRGIKSVDMQLDTSSLEATSRSLQKVKRELGAVNAALDDPMATSLGKWAARMQRTSLETQAAYLGQKAKLQSLLERYESGEMTLAAFARAAAGAKSRLGLLDDSDLSGLESAIRSAKEQMKQLGESTRGTLEGLQDELDGLEGREADIQRRRFDARQRELQAQLAQAQASGDATAISNAARAIGLLRQIEAATEQQRVREDQQKRLEADRQVAPQAASSDAPSKIIRLELKGRAVDVAVTAASDETKLLSILEEAGLRSL